MLTDPTTGKPEVFNWQSLKGTRYRCVVVTVEGGDIKGRIVAVLAKCHTVKQAIRSARAWAALPKCPGHQVRICCMRGSREWNECIATAADLGPVSHTAAGQSLANVNP
jgi:hypothetical protein